VEVVKRRDAFERDPVAFCAAWAGEDECVRKRLLAARKRLPQLQCPDAVLQQASTLCLALGTDGLRGELTLLRAARALAALEGARQVATAHLQRVAAPALRHRLRRNPLDDTGSGARVERAVAELLGAAPAGAAVAPAAAGPAAPAPTLGGTKAAHAATTSR
jgi:magnesium chelatase subunit I